MGVEDPGAIMARLPWLEHSNCKVNNPTGKCCKAEIREFIKKTVGSHGWRLVHDVQPQQMDCDSDADDCQNNGQCQF